MRINKLLLTCLIIVGITVVAVKYNPQQILHVAYTELTKDAKKQVDCLAENIYYEAGVEDRQGQLAVALVTLNRTQDPRFPQDICGVVKQKTNGSCQFSWFCEPKRTKNDVIYRKNLDVALYAYANYENIDDPTRGAIYYHADYVNPGWKLFKTTKIGRHIFYKDKNDDAKVESTTKGRSI